MNAIGEHRGGCRPKYSVLVLMLLTLGLGCNRGRSDNERGGKPLEQYAVTPVQEPSQLKHLGLAVSQTNLGEMGGSSSIPPTPRREPEVTTPQPGSLNSAMQRFLALFRSQSEQATQVLENEKFMVAGADLYRLDCRACHGPDGKGAPPEINSLIGPVQATSATMIENRVKSRGAAIDPLMAKQMAADAEDAIRTRLQNGGKAMPAFKYLRPDEVQALLHYLRNLAKVPGEKPAPILVQESAARIGEHLMKGTCHICHNATGPGGGRMTAMMQGIIPSLASLPDDHSLSAVMRQVQYGSSGMMVMMGGNRMPPFPYFTEEEVAAGYFYLVQYPARP